MAFNFPQSPTLNQTSIQNGVWYKWTGVKWKRLDTDSNPEVIEYTDVKTYTGNTVVLNTAGYNYHKIELTGNTTISDPEMALYSSNIVEIKRPFYSDQAYSISAASYDNLLAYTSDANPLGIYFKPDGTEVYYMGYNGKYIYQLSLRTPWDITSQYAVKNSVTLSAITTTPYGVSLSSDGTKAYFVNITTGQVAMNLLTRAWDITTMSGSSTHGLALPANSGCTSVKFSPDGTKLYVCATQNPIGLYVYTLSAPWYLLSPVGSTYVPLTAQDSTPRDVSFNADGTKFFMLGTTTNKIYQYNVTVPWTANTVTTTYSGISFTLAQSTVNFAFGRDGTKMYGTKNITPASILQYSTYNTPDISVNWPSSIDWEAGTAPTINTGATSLISLTNFGEGKVVGSPISLNLGEI